MHIAPSGSPQPTKQAFICKLYSGFPRIFSQQKPHRRICIPQGARNVVFRKLSLNLKSFFGDAFSQDKENKRRRTSVLQAKFDTVFGKLSPNLKSFFGDVFFRKTRKISDGVLSVLRAKFDAVFGKLSPKPQLIFRRCFFRKTRLLSRRCMCIPQGARNAVLREKLSPNLSTFFGDVFSQDKENKRRRTSVLQAKFDTVLRKNSPKNQISIMSASFFFAISSISLTYLSVIF